jgi:hypothetical protein
MRSTAAKLALRASWTAIKGVRSEMAAEIRSGSRIKNPGSGRNRTRAGRRMIRWQRESFCAEKQIPPLRYAQGRNDKKEGLFWHG